MEPRDGLPKAIGEVRHDLSEWLWHFTRRDNQPFETLKQIVESKWIKGSTDRFCSIQAVCLTEMPVTEAMRQSSLLDERGYNRFSDYGIGFRKKWIFQQGGLPVVYQPNSLLSELGQESQWRHCPMDLKNGLDFTWQREWRVPTSKLAFCETDDVILVVKNNTDAIEIATDDWAIDGERDEVYFDQVWPFVTHQELAAARHPSDVEVMRYRFS